MGTTYHVYASPTGLDNRQNFRRNELKRQKDLFSKFLE